MRFLHAKHKTTIQKDAIEWKLKEHCYWCIKTFAKVCQSSVKLKVVSAIKMREKTLLPVVHTYMYF